LHQTEGYLLCNYWKHVEENIRGLFEDFIWAFGLGTGENHKNI
jgi:hypothetical protein